MKILRNTSRKTVIKYTLLQIPGIIIVISALFFIQKLAGFSDFIFFTVIALWIVKDIVMFPVVRRSYESNPEFSIYSMAGKKGVAKERLDPKGYVLVGSELWQAETCENYPFIDKGGEIIVVKMENLKLIVKPAGQRE